MEISRIPSPAADPATPAPIETLEVEHRVIQKVVAAMVVLAERLDRGERIRPPLLESIVEFLSTFADRCHHGEEEALLFPALESRGVPSNGCPLGGLAAEHQKGRAMVAEFAQAIRAFDGNELSGCAGVVKCLRELTALYPGHIWKEDHLLFPLAAKFLTAEDQRELAGKFAEVEHEFGRGRHERFERLAAALGKEVSGFAAP